MGETDRGVRWNDAALDRHRHVCVFYHDHNEEYRVQENPYFVPPEVLLRELRQQPRQPAAIP